MKKFLLSLFVISCFNFSTFSQNIQRPKLVVGIVVDQMRWDYLYRYYDRYEVNGGFKRMIQKGFSCENTLIPYAPTLTACGHSSIFTGSVPAINGITGNFWWDNELMKNVYCTEDKTVSTIGSSSNQGLQSPRNLLVTTICDELRLATNFRSKVIGVALKDRGCILPAGHSANAAFWYDNSVGKWISSSFYMKDLPKWVNDFNNKKLVDKYYQQGWDLLYPSNTYLQSTEDDKNYESKPFGKKFPYSLSKYIEKDYTKISTTPMGNSLTAEIAKAAVAGENLGEDDITDFLTVSFSSTDYIGHTFGPNSMEAEDCFLRLDRELGSFLDFLDAKVGKGEYTVFLSADHGAVQVPEFLIENKFHGGRVFLGKIIDTLNQQLFEKYKIKELIVSDENYQVHLNHPAIDSAEIDVEDLTQWIIKKLAAYPGIDRVFPLEELNEIPLPVSVRKMFNNGYYPKRSGTIQILLLPGYINAYSEKGTTHGLWNPYDAHIPLLWYGWGIKPGATNRETYMTDIAPTIAALLHIQMPSGNIGKPITEILNHSN